MKNKSNILVISKGILHPSLVSRYVLRKSLDEFSDKYSFVHTNKLADISLLEDDNKQGMHFDACILFYHKKQLNKELTAVLQRYVQQGGALFALHGAMASFKDNEQYNRLMGSRFIGHEAIGHIEVKGVVEDELIDNLFCIKDELYQFSLNDENRVLLMGVQGDKIQPVLWTRQQSNGKIACFSLGHKPFVFMHKEVKKILASTLEWLLAKV